MGHHPLLQETLINPYIWIAVGAFVGWLAAQIASGSGRMLVIENIGVGIFGAFLGGEFVVDLLNRGLKVEPGFQMRSLAFAAVGAVVLVALLRLMRRSVGPMRVSKPKNRSNY